MSIYLPLSVNSRNKKDFVNNLELLTFNGKHTILFAADQRVEHGPTSFLGPGISKDDLYTEHFFKIASKAKVSALAAHYGVICKYAMDYKDVNYVVKLNSITSMVKKNIGYTQSKSWVNVSDVVALKKSENLNIVGVGYTVYLGIKEESHILQEASAITKEAHENGLPVILWIYPKPKSGKEDSFENVAHACMVGEALGADFIKIKPPVKAKIKQEELIRLCTKMAGRSKILVSGGSKVSESNFLTNSYKHIYKGGAFGVAVGRNIHQKPLHEAVNFIEELYFTLTEGNKRFIDKTGVSTIV